MNGRSATYLIFRYLFLILLGLSGILYTIFTPLTVYVSYFFLNILFDAILYPPNVIFFKGYYANIIPACVAGAAYYFLLILNLTTPMKPKKRVLSITFLVGVFFILNVFRIVLFGTLLYKGYQYFDLTHKLSWYLGSTLMVIIIWFANVKVFKLKPIPIYTDIKSLSKEIKSKK